MKNSWILVPFFVSTLAIKAQPHRADSVRGRETQMLQQRKIDSLQKLLHTAPANDTNKVATLFLLSEFYFSDMQYANGLLMAANAKALSNQLAYEKGEALYLQAMAKFHENSTLGFYFKTEADWLLKRQTTIEQQAITITPDYDLEIQKLKEARLLIERKKDSLGTANIDFALMINYLQLNQDSIAMQYAERPLGIFKRHNDILPVFEILRLQMDYFERTGNKAAAKEVELQAIKAITGSSDKKTIALIAFLMGQEYSNRNRFGLAIEFLTKSDAALEELGDGKLRINVLTQIGIAYELAGLNEKAVDYYKRSFDLRKKTSNMAGVANNYIQMAFPLIKLRKFEEAEDYVSRARALIDSSQYPIQFSRSYDAYGQTLMAKGDYRQAIRMFMVILTVCEEHASFLNSSYMFYYLSQCYQKLDDLKQSLRNAQLSYQRAVQSQWPATQITSSLQISTLYDELGQVDKAYEYLKIHKKIKDDLQEQDNLNRVADIEIQAILEKSQRELDVLEKDKRINEETNRNQKLWILSITGALLSAMLVLFILYRNNLQKQKAKVNIEKAYSELKATQQQLIQQGKMASLGELTAGIAHEIQNPLNFVNNFSEVTLEMVEEAKEEVLQSNTNEAVAVLDTVKTNLEKIAHHGKRADRIVKNMMEHARSAGAEKQPTDINVLTDEYFKLAYHGFRAKDNLFTASLETQYDPSVGFILAHPQDIGRVLLNLFNNAFYAVDQKKKHLNGAFEPRVSISTEKKDRQIIITVKDNGIGIPESAKEKIYQPFFTTKPTGEGTGLGLSLSYDIITKGHGGNISAAGKEGEGAEFMISLPLQ